MFISVFVQVEFNPTATCAVAVEPWFMAKCVKRPAEVQPTPKKKLSVKKKDKVGAEFLQSTKKEAGGSRRLQRQTSDDAAIRSIRLKLGMFPKTQVDNNINSKNETAMVMVKNEMRRLTHLRGSTECLEGPCVLHQTRTALEVGPAES